MRTDFFGNKTRSSWPTCMSTFHAHGHVHVLRYVSSLSTFVTQDGSSHSIYLEKCVMNSLCICLMVVSVVENSKSNINYD